MIVLMVLEAIGVVLRVQGLLLDCVTSHADAKLHGAIFGFGALDSVRHRREKSL
jgi:hypothetical protein